LIQENLSSGFAEILKQAGRKIRIIYYTKTTGSVWDDDITLAVSGDVFTSGIIMPLNTQQGSSDSILVEQGRLIDSDLRLFVNGSLALGGSEVPAKIQLGSNAGESYTQIPLGGITPEVEGVQIYKKAYIRRLTTGSIFGEPQIPLP